MILGVRPIDPIGIGENFSDNGNRAKLVEHHPVGRGRDIAFRFEMIKNDSGTLEACRLNRLHGEERVIECSEPIGSNDQNREAERLGKFWKGEILAHGDFPAAHPLDKREIMGIPYFVYMFHHRIEIERIALDP